jgi:hypothetical protein
MEFWAKSQGQRRANTEQVYLQTPVRRTIALRFYCLFGQGHRQHVKILEWKSHPVAMYGMSRLKCFKMESDIQATMEWKDACRRVSKSRVAVMDKREATYVTITSKKNLLLLVPFDGGTELCITSRAFRSLYPY